MESPQSVSVALSPLSSTQTQTTQPPSAILMVRPVDFTYNEQTALDNEFQHKLSLESQLITSKALKEFDDFVALLRSKNIHVLVHDKSLHPDLQASKTPDSVFPNNWIATESNGFLYTFPMCAPNRRAERLAFPHIEKLLLEEDFLVKGTFNLGTTHQDSKFLEGTGSMIIDRQNRVAYATRSLRTDEDSFKEFCKLAGYEAVAFDTESSNGKPYYHTNMMMCIGDTFAVVSKEAIKEEDREKVVGKLRKAGKEVVEISREQAEKCCSGNVLQVLGKDGKRFLAMSERAYKGFTEEQRKVLEKHAEIVAGNIDTLEEIGGGSARCMMCEIYLPKKDRNN